VLYVDYGSKFIIWYNNAEKAIKSPSFCLLYCCSYTEDRGRWVKTKTPAAPLSGLLLFL
jgi:hypothetical protein